jgi:hypothetical protein
MMADLLEKFLSMTGGTYGLIGLLCGTVVATIGTVVIGTKIVLDLSRGHLFEMDDYGPEIGILILGSIVFGMIWPVAVFLCLTAIPLIGVAFGVIKGGEAYKERRKALKKAKAKAKKEDEAYLLEGKKEVEEVMRGP